MLHDIDEGVVARRISAPLEDETTLAWHRWHQRTDELLVERLSSGAVPLFCPEPVGRPRSNGGAKLLTVRQFDIADCEVDTVCAICMNTADVAGGDLTAWRKLPCGHVF